MDSKQRRWQQMRIKMAAKTDRLAIPIDPGILETVVALNLLGFPTSQSCEGHLDYGWAGSWVDVESKETNRQIDKVKRAFILAEKAKGKDVEKEYARANKLKATALRPLFGLGWRLLSLLSEFYGNRKPTVDERIVLEHFGYAIRIASQGAAFQDGQSLAVRKEKLLVYQKEMKEFAQFLKKKYFSDD